MTNITELKKLDINEDAQQFARFSVFMEIMNKRSDQSIKSIIYETDLICEYIKTGNKNLGLTPKQ